MRRSWAKGAKVAVAGTFCGSGMPCKSASALEHHEAEVVDVRRRPSWMRDALCLERLDLDWFSRDKETIDLAKEVCGRCLCRDECLDLALERDDVGIWGGLDRRERRRLKQSADLGLPVRPHSHTVIPNRAAGQSRRLASR